MGDGQAERQAYADARRAVANLARAEAQVERAVQELRVLGVSWAGVAQVLGVSRQAARQRWGARELV